MQTPPEPLINPIVRDAQQLIDDIQAGKGLTSLTAGTAIVALNDMIKRVQAYEDTHPVFAVDAVDDVLDDLADLRDEIAASGLPPQPYHAFDFRTATPMPPDAAEPPAGTPLGAPPVPPTPATVSPVTPPPFLPDADAQRWLSDQKLAHDSPAYRAARDYWLAMVKDYAAVAKDAWPAARGKPGFAGDVAEDVQFRAEDIDTAVKAAFPDPAPPVAPPAVPTTGGGARVKPLPQPPKRAPRRGLTFGRLTALLVLLLILVAGGVVYVAGHGSPGASPAGTVEAITNNMLVDNVGTPCTTPTTLHMKWVLQDVAPGTSVVVDMTGPGLPPSMILVVASDDSIAKDFSVPAGPAVWTTDLATIGSEPAPSANATNKATVSCSGP